MENELTIKRGQCKFHVSENKEICARSLFGSVLDDLKDLKGKYIELGFHLAEFDKRGYYLAFGFSSFKDFCNENMPISYQTCKHCMNVFLNFTEKGITSKQPYLCVEEKYKDFSFSQLVEMLPIDSRRREIIKSDWSVEKIRRYKKGLKKQDETTVDDSDLDDKQPTAEEIFSQVLNNVDVMKFICKAFQSRYGDTCIENLETTAKTAVFECGGEKYRLQLNKVK